MAAVAVLFLIVNVDGHGQARSDSDQKSVEMKFEPVSNTTRAAVIISGFKPNLKCLEGQIRSWQRCAKQVHSIRITLFDSDTTFDQDWVRQQFSLSRIHTLSQCRLKSHQTPSDTLRLRRTLALSDSLSLSLSVTHTHTHIHTHTHTCLLTHSPCQRPTSISAG